MSCHGLLQLRHFGGVLVCVLVCVSVGFCYAAPNFAPVNSSSSTSNNLGGNSSVTTSNPGTIANGVDCSRYDSSCKNCSHHMACAWCFSDKTCLMKEQRNQHGICDEDDWYYGDCDKPEKEAVLVYVLLSCALFLLLIVILLVLYIFFCKMPRNKDYEPVSTKDKRKKRKHTPLMSKKVKPSKSRTDELKKKYQLDG